MSPALRHPLRAARIAAPATAVRSTVLGAAVAGSLAVSGALVPAAASAATPHTLHGRIHSARQTTTSHAVRVSGFAYDGSDPSASVRTSLIVNGHRKRTARAHGFSGRFDRKHHIHGRHAFSVVLHPSHKVRSVRLRVHTAGHGNHTAAVDTHRVRQYTPPAQRIVRVARKYVGSRYSYGADGPNAFDCSGYSKFVYRKAHIAHLPHNSQAQRHAKHMHRISRKHARPGDLVFYLSGNSAYHVAIYAGHGKQYSATDPAQGVEHDRITSHHVVFGTDWH
ncbi:C40 family peptidase [Jatrophihabitans endophyticus]|uniref:C40 family peptidase n=1 Tax=Jatrophihabitans endophyticus TaxID=1206085 RepID=UPI0019E71B5A|nr:NlpC/P60 family protein [Jatrophihabitans endophyticus]MBE7186812.1 C40 family peptidase [Jatrophihabitans endophyticus]